MFCIGLNRTHQSHKAHMALSRWSCLFLLLSTSCGGTTPAIANPEPVLPLYQDAAHISGVTADQHSQLDIDVGGLSDIAAVYQAEGALDRFVLTHARRVHVELAGYVDGLPSSVYAVATLIGDSAALEQELTEAVSELAAMNSDNATAPTAVTEDGIFRIAPISFEHVRTPFAVLMVTSNTESLLFIVPESERAEFENRLRPWTHRLNELRTQLPLGAMSEVVSADVISGEHNGHFTRTQFVLSNISGGRYPYALHADVGTPEAAQYYHQRLTQQIETYRSHFMVRALGFGRALGAIAVTQEGQTLHAQGDVTPEEATAALNFAARTDVLAMAR